jgi:hypothetical protein
MRPVLSCRGKRTAGGPASGILELGGAAGAGGAALQGAALVFAHTAPDAGILTGLQRPLQARVDNGASTANTFCFLDLQEGRTGVSYGEEKLRVLVKARCAVTPIHADQSLHFLGTH